MATVIVLVSSEPHYQRTRENARTREKARAKMLVLKSKELG